MPKKTTKKQTDRRVSMNLPSETHDKLETLVSSMRGVSKIGLLDALLDFMNDHRELLPLVLSTMPEDVQIEYAKLLSDKQKRGSPPENDGATASRDKAG